jgi:hypothetical protein
MTIQRGNIFLKIPTTDKAKLWSLIWDIIAPSEYCLGWGVETWTYSSGEMLYWLLLDLDVRSNLDKPTIERFILSKIKYSQLNNNLRNNKGTPVISLEMPMSYRYKYLPIILRNKKRSLLSIDITKVRRLSIKDIKLPTTERRVDPITPVSVERPLTDEDIAYGKLVAINPLIEELVERLDLVSITPGERIKKVELQENIKPHPIQIDSVIKVLEPENSYTKEEVINRIVNKVQVGIKRAETIFYNSLYLKEITKTIGDRYHLTGSTPF